jgi:putative sigma-54 modulation protein
MDIRVSGKQLEIGEALPAQIRRRLSTAIEKHFSGMVEGNVIIMREGAFYRTDCAVHLGSGANLQTQGIAGDPYKSSNEAIEKLEKRVRRYARKLKSHHRSEPHTA